MLREEATGYPSLPPISLLVCLLHTEPLQQLWVKVGTSLGLPWPEGFCGNTLEAQRARSMIVYKDHEMGQGRSQVRVGG